jgi:ankyrin repeat protein
LLLADRAEINAKDNDGRTPLHLAAFKGYVGGLLRQPRRAGSIAALGFVFSR